MTKLIDVYELLKLEDEEDIDEEITGLKLAHKALLEVEVVEDTYIEYVSEYNCGDDTCEKAHVHAEDLDINEDGYIIYDLREGYEMFEGKLTDVEGLYVYGFETEAGEGYDVFVIFE